MFKPKLEQPFLIVFCVLVMFLSGCVQSPPRKTAAEHQQELGSTQEKKTTLGLFQSLIREGMSQADVAAAVGSPNIVTQDAEGNDTWIYDKISTETSHSDSSQAESQSISAGGVIGGVIGGVAGALTGIGGSKNQSQSSSAGASSQSQKTLTVVIKFDQDRKVSNLRYQTSSF